ncbi:MAG: SH3 domain-containing protein [Spirochaetota bacterium]
MKKVISTALVVLFISTSSYAAKYGIINADKVNMRAKPATNAPSLGFLEEGELVYSIEKTQEKAKIGADEYYWYKIENHKKTIGYVYGEFIYDYNESNVTEKEFTDIVDISYKLHLLNGKIIGIRLDKIDSLIFFKAKMIRSSDGSGGLFVFDSSGGKTRCVIWDGLDDEDYYVDTTLVFIWKTSRSIRVYDRYSFEKRDYIGDDSLYYKSLAGYNIYTHHPEADYKDRGLNFDPKTMTLTVTVREPKDAPIKTERFKFNGKEFVPLN